MVPDTRRIGSCHRGSAFERRNLPGWSIIWRGRSCLESNGIFSPLWEESRLRMAPSCGVLYLWLKTSRAILSAQQKHILTSCTSPFLPLAISYSITLFFRLLSSHLFHLSADGSWLEMKWCDGRLLKLTGCMTVLVILVLDINMQMFTV